MGRTPYKFTPARQKDYLEKLADGMRRGRAAFEVGLDTKTIDRHLATDPEFVILRDQAESRVTDDVEESLAKSAKSGNVPAAIKWLETMRPEVWKADREPAPLGSATNPMHVALPPGQIDWSLVPDHLADRFLALHDEMMALQPASGGMIINEDGSPAEDDEPLDPMDKPF